MDNKPYLKKVRDQYESYPYPFRDPSQESHRLVEIGIERLDLINFYCFKGACDFNQFRVLVAGGGTGDSVIFLAEQLKHTTAEVWYVDISQASMDIAKQRAKQRNLSNINWLHTSLLSLDENMGKFDYISCTGVLHHLDDPLLGLQTLKNLLNDNGAMGLMLYGEYGRTGVYQMQQLMRMINVNENNLANKVINTKKILANLPETNWFTHNEKFLVDHINGEDNGLVDLLLHEQDRAYSIVDVYQLLEQSALKFVEFSDVKMRMSYRPEQYIKDSSLLKIIKQRPINEQHGIAELLVGAFKKHEFYAAVNTDTKASFTDLSNIPFFFPAEHYKNLGNQLANAILASPNKVISMKHSSGFEFDLSASQLNYAIFKNIDGKNTLQIIFEEVRKELKSEALNNEQLVTYISQCFKPFIQLDWILLRAS